jgi:hypothetical protein
VLVVVLKYQEPDGLASLGLTPGPSPFGEGKNTPTLFNIHKGPAPYFAFEFSKNYRYKRRIQAFATFKKTRLNKLS